VGATETGTMQVTEKRSGIAEKQLSWNLQFRRVPLMLWWSRQPTMRL
jgi:hypothetical protein